MQVIQINLDSSFEQWARGKNGAVVDRQGGTGIDLSDGQFSERCDVDGSFFNSDAIPIIFGKA